MDIERLVARIAEEHRLGAPVARIESAGSVNHAFRVGDASNRFVVRLPVDPLRSDEYEAESWCLIQAAARGIPSPRVVASGTAQGVRYLIQTYVDGVPGGDVDPAAMWSVLADYARVIHTIPLTSDAPNGLFTRFGRSVSSAWRQHLDFNISQLASDDPLLGLGVYPASRQAAIRTALVGLQRRSWTFGLRHGDLSPRNLILAPSGDPVLIDWGCASAGPVPAGDLLPVVEEHRATGRPALAVVERFAAALGLPLDASGRLVDDLVVLGALDLVRWAIDRRPDRLAEIVARSRRLIGDPA